MPYLPDGDSPHITAGIPLDCLATWIDSGVDIPRNGPHTLNPTRFGCTINQDFKVDSTRTRFEKGMQGSLIEEKTFDIPKQGKVLKVKIFIEGVTPYWYLDPKTKTNVWVTNQWVLADCVTKGEPWKRDIKDWPVNLELQKLHFDTTPWMRSPATDTSLLGRTITALITAFHSSPPPFMGTKLESLVKKMSIDTISRIITKGIQKARASGVLEEPSLGGQRLLNTATHRIDENYERGLGGVYIRMHVSNNTISYWKKQTRYLYVGKTVGFRERWSNHRYTATKYGELTRNSERLDMCAVCIIADQYIEDLAYLVEQIFVCLFGSYRRFLLSEKVNKGNASYYLAAVEHANYFSEVARLVFEQTGWRQILSRAQFDEVEGANFESPLQEWAVSSEHLLLIRTDTRIKDQRTGRSTPMAFFRSAKAKLLNHNNKASPSGTTTWELWAKKKTIGDVGKKAVAFHITDNGMDGTKIPLAGVPYYLVVEVCKDGSPHPNAWSRLSEVGPFENWDQARSFAVRVEWEFPQGSGKWRYRYVHTYWAFKYADTKQPGALQGYARAIAFLHGIRDTGTFGPGSILGTGSRDVPRLTAEDIAYHDIVYSALCMKPLSTTVGDVQPFRNRLIELDSSAKDEEDPSDVPISAEEAADEDDEEEQ
ncbi:hypothetical protein N0V87_002258 [Didymella glomerata]|uniref:GIY-YIG domain-containing protein n=1 Tax=Didymella glomerata TaxID=749621 RepID=A0A9W8X4K3_9PLEO|nr:hypothetical protein N0V87_002258 [Didymella glomerata]